MNTPQVIALTFVAILIVCSAIFFPSSSVSEKDSQRPSTSAMTPTEGSTLSNDTVDNSTHSLEDKEESFSATSLTTEPEFSDATSSTTNKHAADSTTPSGAPPRTRPHIVLVIADDMGYHDIGYHGSFIQTPTMDQLAYEGVRLENYYVQPVCSPTRSQLLSGRYQIHTGIQHSVFFSEQPIGLPTDNPTLADQLQKSGYSTHLVGKWHVGYYRREYLPHNRGFNSFFGKLQGHGDHYKHTRSYKGKQYLDLWQEDEPIRNETGHYSTHLFTERAVRVVENHDANTPLFLMLAYQAPHAPLQVPQSYKDLYKTKVNKKRRAFAGMVTAMDEGIANLTRALKHQGLWNNTLFIFSTDNGGDPKAGGNNYPLRGGKRTLWEGGIRGVAFVTGGASLPISRGHVNKNLIHVSDWFPTLVAGVAGSRDNDTKPLDGVNQWPGLVRANAPAARNMILHNIDPLQKRRGRRLFSNKTFDTRKRAAIRVGDLKLITGVCGKGDWVAPPEKKSIKSKKANENLKKNLWLFNITADPNETDDISKARPADVRRLLDMLHSLDATSVPAYYPKKDPRANPALHGNVWGPW
ncbi:arylsulfatase b [Plakobranchus ocellatus]|uniref:Arylsulfatase b n=1 Tax=Plakobranchus ocellatus TaxID=259542 RepID=A0AAV4AWU4_9GAST|nr:arylsulfatase b [Plakobranchus ocellatus]